HDAVSLPARLLPLLRPGRLRQGAPLRPPGHAQVLHLRRLRRQPGPAAHRDGHRRRWGTSLPPDDRREPEGSEARPARRADLPEDPRGGRHAQLLLEVYARALRSRVMDIAAIPDKVAIVGIEY